ncbi:MAG: hypothetical protein HYT47_02400 [Candidatus Vogelbacteria bacterium]|nr:hypothetical protein [Candidatus Vogelbacteria bacterium]
MAKDWTKIYEKYKGLWVALAEDEETVLAAGKTLKQALEEARQKGHRHPIMTRMPEKLVAYVGWVI